jgi:RimJ/RimL family protein N-acetyltransferase
MSTSHTASPAPRPEDRRVAPPPPVPLHTGRLRLRYYRDGDAEALLGYYGREDTTRYLLDAPWDEEKARHEVAERKGRLHIEAAGYAVSLVVEEADTVVGDITLWAVDHTLSLGELSWVFHPEAGGRGLATEAAQAVLDLAFGHYGMHRLRARMDARNTASARLCERLGFRREGLLRQDWFIKGQWTDTLVYGLLASER